MYQRKIFHWSHTLLVYQSSAFLLLGCRSIWVSWQTFPFPIKLLVDDLSVQSVVLSDLLVLQLVLVVTDRGDGDGGVLPHRPEVLGDHPLLGQPLLRDLAVNVYLADALVGSSNRALEHEDHIFLWVVLVKKLESTGLAFVPVLLLDPLSPFRLMAWLAVL